MKKNSSGCKSPKASMKATQSTNVTVGMDLVDKTSRYCMLVNAARGLTKATRERLPSCDADQMGVERMECYRRGCRTRCGPCWKK